MADKSKYIDAVLESIRAPTYYDFAAHATEDEDDRLSGDSWFERNGE